MEYISQTNPSDSLLSNHIRQSFSFFLKLSVTWNAITWSEKSANCKWHKTDLYRLWYSQVMSKRLVLKSVINKMVLRYILMVAKVT